MLDKKYEQRKRLATLNRMAKERRRCTGNITYHELPERNEDGSKGYWLSNLEVYIGDSGVGSQLNDKNYFTEVDSQGLQLYTTIKEQNDNLVANYFMFKRAAEIHCNKQTRQEAKEKLRNIERKVENRLKQHGQIKSTKIHRHEIESMEVARRAGLKREGVSQELVNYLITNSIIKNQKDLDKLDAYKLMKLENEMNDIG